MTIRAAGLTDVGQEREQNEDSFCIVPEFDLYVVADGMGGHSAGEVASRMATNVMASFFLATAREDATWPFHFDPQLTIEENRLVSSIRMANKRIFDTSLRNRAAHNMGTTVVGILVSKDRSKAHIAHVGDSRCYRVRNGQITQLTRDHSLANEHHLMGDLPAEWVDDIPKNVITRALGMSDTVNVDLRTEVIESGDVFLLCSDGLSGMVKDDAICSLVVDAQGDLQVAVKGLIDRANQNGGDDNVTVVMVGA